MEEYKISTMTYKQMAELHSALEQEMAARQQVTFNHLVKNVCDAIAELRKVFPYSTLSVGTRCDECGEFTSANIFAYGTETIAPHFFAMH